MYHDKLFYKLSFNEAVLAFLHGLRFDLSIVFSIYGVPTLIGFLPLSKVRAWKFVQEGVLWTLVALYVAQIFFLIGDLFYFGQVKRHMFDELVSLAGEWDFIFDTLLGGYIFYLLGFFAIVGWACRWFWKVLKRQRSDEYRAKWWHSLAFLLLSVLVIRGGFGLKPLGIVDAYAFGGAAGGQLTLNGVFSGWHASRNSEKMEYPKIQEQRFRAFTNKLGLDASDNPFYRSFSPVFGKERKLNVVVILLESWSQYYVDSFGQNNFGVTPNLDRISREGVKFENFLATGSRSIEAIQAILTSFPSLKGLPTLGLGFELMNTAAMGAATAEVGYESVFMQSAKRESFRLHSVANAFGFTQYYGLEDYPDLGNATAAPAFGWDREMFMHSINVFDRIESPFVSFMFTGTTHTPFRKFEAFKYAEKSGPENEEGFLNTLHYADAALGEFFVKAKERKWFKDTVFILTADHTFGAFRNFEFIESFKVPLVIYAPGLIEPRVEKKFGSHLDVLPTLLHITGTETPISLTGRSLFEDQNYNFAFLSQRYANPAWVDEKGYIVSNMETIIDSNTVPDCRKMCQEDMHDDLKNFSAFLYESIRNNSWMPTTKK